MYLKERPNNALFRVEAEQQSETLLEKPHQQQTSDLVFDEKPFNERYGVSEISLAYFT